MKHSIQLNPEKVDELIKEYREWNIAMHDELSSEFDGVSETLRLLKEEGYENGDSFNKEKQYGHERAELLDAEGVFDVIIGMDDVTNTKPDPEPFYLR